MKGCERRIFRVFCWLAALAIVLVAGCSEQASESKKSGESEQKKQQLTENELPSKVQIRQIQVAWRELIRIYGKELPPAAVERSRNDARLVVETARKELRQGGDWKDIATRYSDTPYHPNGLTMARDGNHPAPLQKRAFSLGIGENDIVETSFGWHLIERIQ